MEATGAQREKCKNIIKFCKQYFWPGRLKCNKLQLQVLHEGAAGAATAAGAVCAAGAVGAEGAVCATQVLRQVL